jgi:hypothetical protein
MAILITSPMVDAEIAKLGLSKLRFRKSAPAAEMRKLYSQYDALLFTSNWGEPFALTPLEAMSSGLPVITSLDGGQPELARHEVNCLIAEAANPELYATRIAELAASPHSGNPSPPPASTKRDAASTSIPSRARSRLSPQGPQVMSILFYDDSPVFGGTPRGDEPARPGSGSIRLCGAGSFHRLLRFNGKLCEKVAALGVKSIRSSPWRRSHGIHPSLEALRNRLQPSRIKVLANRFRQLRPIARRRHPGQHRALLARPPRRPPRRHSLRQLHPRAAFQRGNGRAPR